MVNTAQAVIIFVDSADQVRQSWTSDKDGIAIIVFMTDDGHFISADYVQVGDTRAYASKTDYNIAYGTAHTANNTTYCIKSMGVKAGDTITIASARGSYHDMVDLEYAVVVFMSAA